MVRISQIKPLGALIGVLLVSTSLDIRASGFALIENSAAGMGNAFAGGAAIAEDASTVFFNPAGMSRLEGSQLIFAGHLISPSHDYSDKGSYVNPTLTGGTPVPGSLTGGNDESNVVALVPNVYFVRKVDDKWSTGIGINAPFGLETDYDNDWVGRYHARQSKILTINVNPSVSYQVNEKLSLGAGVNAQYIRATLSQAIDYGTACFGFQNSGLLRPGTCEAAGALPLTADGQGKVKGSDWSWGFNLGALFEFSEATRMGIQYRSSISHDLGGRATFRVPDNFPGDFLPLFNDTGLSAAVDLPETVSISLFHQLNEKFALMGDATWTKWSRFDELRIQYDNPYQPDSVQPENWDNSMRYSLGLTYTPGNDWIFRTGVAYDESPVPEEFRTPRIPGQDRTWLSLGIGHKVSEQMTINLGYAHLFVDDTPIVDTEISTGHTLVGEYTADVDIFSGEIQFNF